MARFRKVLTRFDDYRDMLSDRVRMDAYGRAIAAVVKPGDVVVDLGAGLGILSMLAVRAGAARVYAIEQGDAVELARAVVARNGMQDRIELLADNSRRVELPRRADVLLSETLGSFGLEENTLDFSIDARDRLLSPGGRMLPHAITAYLAPVEHSEGHGRLSFWDDIAGFDFSPAVQELMGRMSLLRVAPKALLGKPQVFADVDLLTETHAALQRKMLFAIERRGILHGLAGWFRASLAPGVEIATSPTDPKTHWQQAFFPFREPIAVVPGDYLEVLFRISPRAEDSDDTVVSYDYRCTQTAAEQPSPAGAAAQVGRNDPCPCGSGKKYKRCCGAA